MMMCEECNSPETYNDSDEDGRGYWNCMNCGHWTFDEEEDDQKGSGKWIK